MIKDITIGQYFPADSFLHRLDPRTKLVMTFVFIVTVFLAKNFFNLGLVCLVVIVAVAVSKVPAKIIFKSLKAITLLVLFTSAINIFFVETGDTLIKYSFIHITTGGVFTAIFVAIRIICLIISSSLLTYTTTPTMLTDAIEWSMKPLKLLKINSHYIAMIMTIALRFIPTLIDEIDRIMSAQKARGADMETGNFVQRIKAMIPIFVPLLVSSFRRAYELAFAMECRCYSGGNGRTRMKQMKFKGRDFAAGFAVIGILAGVIILNIFITPVM